MILRIIGQGLERKALEAKAIEVCRQGVGEIQFDGWLAQTKIAEVLQHSRALVLPSLYECGGAVVLEAMACGCPVVATNWGGPADYLDETCGILVNPTSRTELIAGISAALCRLVDDEKFHENLSRHALKKSVQFRWDNKVQKILQVYCLAGTLYSSKVR
jgi:glycosyltransferase involved in cell wall biosynthesis